jgi:membrane protease YdiL (CAAX protease family)
MTLYSRLRSRLEPVVWGGERSRPRAVWRILVPFAVVLATGIGTAALSTATGVADLALQVLLATAGDVLVALAVLVVLVGAARSLDRRDVADYGFRFSRAWWVDLAAGAVLGVLVVSAAFLLASARGGVVVVATLSAGDADPVSAAVLLFVVGYLCTAVWEESLFRGVLMTNAAEGLVERGLPAGMALLGALGVSAVVFGTLHAPLSRLPGGTALSWMLAVWTLMGGLLGLGYVLSGELAFPMGLHFTANLAVVNGYLGQGTPVPPSVLRTEVTASAAWHPFGGLPFVLAILGGYGLALAWFRWRHGTVSLAEAIATPPTGTVPAPGGNDGDIYGRESR